MYLRQSFGVVAILTVSVGTICAQDSESNLSREETEAVSKLKTMNVRPIERSTGLVDIYFRRVTLNESIATQLKRISTLGTLSIHRHALTDEDVRMLQGVQFKRLHIGSVDISEEGAELLADMTALGSLQLSYNDDMTDEKLRLLSRLKLLKEL